MNVTLDFFDNLAAVAGGGSGIGRAHALGGTGTQFADLFEG